MRKGIFSKLAVQNIRNNKSTYIPYMITCIFCIAMIYMMEFLRDCPTLDQAVRHAAEVRMILSTGEVVVVIFCVIFLIYSNSFLMKRRQKEIGLYNILGLERNHIGIVLLLETIFTTILSLTGGIAIGILASKLSLLLLLRLLHIPAVLGFYISTKGIITCLLMFGAIFLLILLLNLRRIHLSRPVELLRGNNTGEREPKAKWLMALLGFICLGIGYYLAITTESPIKLPACRNPCYGRNLSAFYCRQYCNSEVSSPQKKLLLQDWKFYQYFRYALPYEAERCRAGQYLYLKYRSFTHDFHDCLYLFWYE